MNRLIEKQRIAIAEAIEVLRLSPISGNSRFATKAELLREAMPALLDLRARGYTYRQIAEQMSRSGFAVTMQTVRGVITQHNRRGGEML